MLLEVENAVTLLRQEWTPAENINIYLGSKPEIEKCICVGNNIILPNIMGALNSRYAMVLFVKATICCRDSRSNNVNELFLKEIEKDIELLSMPSDVKEWFCENREFVSRMAPEFGRERCQSRKKFKKGFCKMIFLWFVFG